MNPELLSVEDRLGHVSSSVSSLRTAAHFSPLLQFPLNPFEDDLIPYDTRESAEGMSILGFTFSQELLFQLCEAEGRSQATPAGQLVRHHRVSLKMASLSETDLTYVR